MATCLTIYAHGTLVITVQETSCHILTLSLIAGELATLCCACCYIHTLLYRCYQTNEIYLTRTYFTMNIGCQHRTLLGRYQNEVAGVLLHGKSLHCATACS